MDFANTQYSPSGKVTELLESYEDVQAWFLQAALCTEKKVLKESVKEKYFNELLAYRGLIKKSCFAYVDKKEPLTKLVQKTNEILLATKVHPEVIFEEEGYNLHFSTKASTHNELLVSMAIEVMKLLTSKHAKYIKKCNNHTCSLLFVDTSKNHSRRWCSMETCGNRTKVSRFSKRQKELFN